MAQFDRQSSLNGRARLFPKRPALLLILLAVLFAAALGIRLYRINEPPLFTPIREYHSLSIARDFYFRIDPSIPEWRQEVAKVSAARPYGMLEPPILEGLTALAWRIVGGEYIWIPRALSSLFWLVGGVFLYLIVRRMGSTGAAIFSTALYLFLPFGVWASTAFMPDPLMVMMLIISIFTILRYHDDPSIRRLLLAGAVSAFAILVKPFCAFPVFGVFLSLAVLRQGLRRATIDRRLLTFAVVSLAPAVLYYSYGVFFAGGILHNQAESSFRPHLLLHMFFWENWGRMIALVLSDYKIAFEPVALLRHAVELVGLLLFALALVGVLLSRRGVPRALMLGLWTGYFIFGLVFTFHIATHAYYSLSLIAIVALSVPPAFAPLADRLSRLGKRWLRPTVACAGLILVMAIGIIVVVTRPISGLSPQMRNAAYLTMAGEVGDKIGHSTNTVFLDPESGFALQYYGELSGFPWPYESFKGLMSSFGSANLEITAEKLFYRDYAPNVPEYFIVTDLEEFGRQADLRSFLSAFPVLAENGDYVIYDLRGTDWTAQPEGERK